MERTGLSYRHDPHKIKSGKIKTFHASSVYLIWQLPIYETYLLNFHMNRNLSSPLCRHAHVRTISLQLLRLHPISRVQLDNLVIQIRRKHNPTKIRQTKRSRNFINLPKPPPHRSHQPYQSSQIQQPTAQFPRAKKQWCPS